jgi:hypothetical protein
MTDFENADTGYRIQDTRYQIPDTGYRIPDTGFYFLNIFQISYDVTIPYPVSCIRYQ